jgi:hypothetical protein
MPTSDLASRAKQARELAGFATVPPWAKKLGLSTTAIYLIEDGTTRDLKAATADGMAKLSGLRSEWIRTGEEPRVGSQIREPEGPAYRASQPMGQPGEMMALAVEVAKTWAAAHQLEGPIEAHPALLETAFRLVLEADASESPSIVRLLEKLAARLSEENVHGDQ